ncbi:hypothetical protein [Candidatus Amarolinea dominans]|uniref:hypothetical protein n=1 Tax=Candidatus Amarolinea dominans TaxID=3140696 RepID=UPI0031CCC55A
MFDGIEPILQGGVGVNGEIGRHEGEGRAGLDLLAQKFANAAALKIVAQARLRQIKALRHLLKTHAGYPRGRAAAGRSGGWRWRRLGVSIAEDACGAGSYCIG